MPSVQGCHALCLIASDAQHALQMLFNMSGGKQGLEPG